MPPSKTQHSTRDHSPGVHVVAAGNCRDDTLGCDDGFAGLRIKQQNPGFDTPRADLNLIEAGEKYYIWDSGEVDVEIPAGLGFAPLKGTRLWIDPTDDTLHDSPDGPVAEHLVTGAVINNNAIRWTDREDDGDIRVQLVDPAGNSQALAVDVDGHDVIVSLATSAGGAITSTAAQVIAAVREHDAASGLVLVANEGASSGAGVVAAVALTPLDAGAAASRLKLGIVRYIGPERGLSSGLMTVSFDARKDF